MYDFIESLKDAVVGLAVGICGKNIYIVDYIDGTITKER